MKDPTNIECFEYAAGGILGRLYQEFPRPLVIIPRRLEAELSASMMIPLACIWPESKGRPSENLVASTLDWLKEEGLIRHTGNTGGRFSGVVLTAKGLASLNSPILPDGGETEKSVGQMLVDQAEKGILTGISSAISTVIKISLLRAGL